MKFISKKTENTLELGERIGKKLFAGAVIALEGDLGGGKTTFTKGLARGLGIKEEITSPSFTLEKIYKLLAPSRQSSGDGDRENNNLIADSWQRGANLYHFDFYRIDNPKDMVSYELIEALEDPAGIVVVEWAEKIKAELPKEKLVVKFHYKEVEERLLEFIPTGGKYQHLIEK